MQTESRQTAIDVPAAANRHSNEAGSRRLLAVCNVDSMAWGILRQWLAGLKEKGYEVHIACAPGEYSSRLTAMGFCMHPIAMRRTFWPWAHIRSLFQLRKLMSNERFAAINTHSAVGGTIGRIAAWLSGCKAVIYTVHGFYFHDDMPPIIRHSVMAVEWLLGRVTTGFMFVSAEDSKTAVKSGIVPRGVPHITIFNGVDLSVFLPRKEREVSSRNFKQELGIGESTPVVGIVGRIVREKGHREFLEMAIAVSKKRKVTFVVVGDTLPSDRDPFAPVLKENVAQAGLTADFIFTGITDRVADYLSIMDIFVLPSYREGFPRSVIEAMSAGLPVVATDIRGSREAVIHEKTGLIVPPRDGVALAEAVARLLDNPQEALVMGRAGRERAINLYDYLTVQEKFVHFINALVSEEQDVA